ncbi:glutamate-rich protein 6-like isoform X1 [Mizuhopecten yessoensis]|uniref:glutamate-rich protein 6-like isoform X1 n=1 Tax=Mizuhopecten yessoensis TaxID=6573 RepID=UPI000B459156|nr:glutamate-rich protein 6-like isoform X1 [Mizuhopecten yessoensis]
MSSKNLSDSTPLPPITSRVSTDPEADLISNHDSDSETDIQLQRPDSSASEASTTSAASSAVLDQSGQGKVRPSVVRGFRRESDVTDLAMSLDSPGSGKRGVSSSSKNGKSKNLTARETTRRKTYDGREILFITQDVQTDWDWVQEAERTGKGKQIIANESTLSARGKRGSKEDLRRSSDEEGRRGKADGPEGQKKGKDGVSDGKKDDKAGGRSSYPFPDNDEFGIPMLELSSDTDSSSDEDAYNKKTTDDRNFMPSVGPPQILQYIRESEKQEVDMDDPGALEQVSEEDEDYPVDEHGRSLGMLGGHCEFCEKDIKLFPTLEQQQNQPPEELYCCNQYREFVEFATSQTAIMEEEHKSKTKMISVKSHPRHGDKQARLAARERAERRIREREMQRRQQEVSGMQQQAFMAGKSKGMGNPHGQQMYSHKDSVARQMKTINYMLSSQRCLEEGWTIRAPSPLLPEEHEDIFVPEPLNPAMIASGNLYDRPLIEKFYEDGQKFLTMFPDGTGNVFYPSGNLAISISSVTLGQYTYVVQEDSDLPVILSVFEPNGYATCYHPNNVIRLCMEPFGGIELDAFGNRRRRWSWKDQETHVHAPPFQPIHFGLNKYTGVRVMSQDRIALTLSAKQRSCRFNVGAKLKLINPESVPSKELDDTLIFLDDKKNRVETLLDRVSTLLKFPKSPKLEKILPPLSLTSRVTKTEKMKKERAQQIAALEAKKTKQPGVVTVN